MDERTRKFIAKYVEDMHSLVSHGLQPFAQQMGESGMGEHPDAKRAISTYKATLERHESMLRERLKAMGTSPTTAVQDVAAAVAGAVAGLYNQVRTEAVSKSLRDDYTFISHCGMSWLMLGCTARSLGDHETEEMAEQGYRDCARMAMEIDDLMPRVLMTELRQDGFTPMDVSAWSRQFVNGAWSQGTRTSV